MDTLPIRFGKKEILQFCGEKDFRIVRRDTLTDEVLKQLQIPLVQFETWKIIPFKYRDRLKKYLENCKKSEGEA